MDAIRKNLKNCCFQNRPFIQVRSISLAFGEGRGEVFLLYSFPFLLFFVYLHSQLVLVTEIKRESGENPEQSRCCVRIFSGKQMSLSRNTLGKTLIGKPQSQKTCHCRCVFL
jgi:hypothetical protein